MEYYLDALSYEDRKPVIDIFNYYIENSFAAFFETKVSYDFFDWLMNISEGYPRVAIKLDTGEVAGFAFLRSYSPIPAFRRVAEISYFIKPQYTRRGIGKAVLGYQDYASAEIYHRKPGLPGELGLNDGGPDLFYFVNFDADDVSDLVEAYHSFKASANKAAPQV